MNKHRAALTVVIDETEACRKVRYLRVDISQYDYRRLKEKQQLTGLHACHRERGREDTLRAWGNGTRLQS